MTAAPPRTVAIVTPAPRGSRAGNRVTALRWARLLRRLGHRVVVAAQVPPPPVDALLAIHARKSAAAVAAFAARGGARATAVLLAGTDVYPAFAPDAALLSCLEQAHRIVALQPLAADLLPTALRGKVRTIVQSARVPPAARPTDHLQACVLAHLRAVKDPLLPFAALELLPHDLPIAIDLAGAVLEPALGARAAAHAAADPRAHWRGELRRGAALQLLAGSHLCIVPSRGEGGANVLSEALAAGAVPLVSAIPGNLGLLGADWPGRFPVGDAPALAALLRRFATEPAFAQDLRRRTAALQPLVAPEREQQALAALLADLGVG